MKKIYTSNKFQTNKKLLKILIKNQSAAFLEQEKKNILSLNRTFHSSIMNLRKCKTNQIHKEINNKFLKLKIMTKK